MSQVLKYENSFTKFGRAQRKGRNKGNFIRRKSMCKGTSSFTIGKGETIRVAGAWRVSMRER